MLVRPRTSIEAPDCHLLEVWPKQAATSRERRKRLGSSIAVLNVDVVTGPTPGIAMNRTARLAS